MYAVLLNDDDDDDDDVMLTCARKLAIKLA